MRLSCWILPLVALATPCWAQSPTRTTDLRTVTTTGSAEVRVVPDRIVMTLGIWSRNAALDAAKEDNEARTRRVLAFLRGRGIPASQIRTDYLVVNPNADWGYTERKYTYDMRRNVVVTLTNPMTFESILNGVVANGVDNVVSIRFLNSELKKHREQARALAIRAAREKAEKLCGELGARAGIVQTIEEDRSGEESGGWDWWGWYWWGGSPRGMSQQVIVQAPASPGSGSLETLALGEIPISAAIRVTFRVD